MPGRTDAPLPGQPGSLADAPHRVVVGQRKRRPAAGGAQTDDCGDGKLSPSLLYPEWMWRSYAAIIGRVKHDPGEVRREVDRRDATPWWWWRKPFAGRRTTRRAYRARRPARSSATRGVEAWLMNTSNGRASRRETSGKIEMTNTAHRNGRQHGLGIVCIGPHGGKRQGCERRTGHHAVRKGVGDLLAQRGDVREFFSGS